MSDKVSVILISHNIYPLNLFTLYSLEKQNYDLSKLEVILVDDYSTDNTHLLKNYRAPFIFKYLRSNSNLGRSGAKNLGLKEVTGNIIIFLDGEVMVDPNFVANHVRHNSKTEKTVVSGSSSQFSVYSVLHPKYNRRQLRKLFSLKGTKPQMFRVLDGEKDIPQEYKQSINKLLRYQRKKNKVITLLSRDDIASQHYQQFAFPAPNFPKITEVYNGDLTGYHLAWTFFITRNVSVSRSILDSVGTFNEEFKGWGYEDWELGLRLYKKGVKFFEDPEIITYHQEHPVSLKDKTKEIIHNYSKLVELHPQIEASAMILGVRGKRSFLEVNDIISDYYLLEKDFPEQYTYFRRVFIELAQKMLFLEAAEKPITGLLPQLGIKEETDKKEKLFLEVKTLRKTKKYLSLLSAFDLLSNL